MTTVETPDFYRYPWAALDSAGRDGNVVVCRWPDGSELRAFDLWLYENRMGAAIDLATRESVADPADLPIDETWSRDSMAAAVDDRGALVVSWLGQEWTYHPGWLRHIADDRHGVTSWLPEIIPWKADDLGGIPPTHDGATVGEDPEVLERWVADLIRYGIARLEGAGVDPDLSLTLAKRIGAIRDTNFGLIWDVKADRTPNSTANTNLRLCPHTDLPTRETPPGFQFLHCIVNDTAGGHSTMTDGLAIASFLEEHHPEHYDALTTLRWIFFNRGATVDHRWSGPIIDHGVPGSPITFRAFHPVRAFPDMAERDMPRAYEALACFGQLAADPRFQLRFPFRPGDIVGFDNRRILHGRDGYESNGRRHLRGLYMDHDDIHSYSRVRARARALSQTDEESTEQHARP